MKDFPLTYFVHSSLTDRLNKQTERMLSLHVKLASRPTPGLTLDCYAKDMAFVIL